MCVYSVSLLSRPASCCCCCWWYNTYCFYFFKLSHCCSRACVWVSHWVCKALPRHWFIVLWVHGHLSHTFPAFMCFFFPLLRAYVCVVCDAMWSEVVIWSVTVLLWYPTCDDRSFELKPFLTRCEVVRKEDNHTPVFQLQSSSGCSFWCTSKHFFKGAQTWPYCLVFISTLLMQSRAYTHKTRRINRSFFSFHTASFLFSGC